MRCSFPCRTLHRTVEKGLFWGEQEPGALTLSGCPVSLYGRRAAVGSHPDPGLIDRRLSFARHEKGLWGRHDKGAGAGRSRKMDREPQLAAMHLRNAHRPARSGRSRPVLWLLPDADVARGGAPADETWRSCRASRIAGGRQFGGRKAEGGR
jgi:hypothetical protein